MPSILILEDDITFALMLSTWLRKKDFEVKTVVSVSDAIRQIEEKQYDLILSDLRLPNEEGLDLLRWMKEANRSFPVIMMTSYAGIQTAVQAIKLGASDYIEKPLNPEELLTKIKELLKNARPPQQKAVDDEYIKGDSAVTQQMYEYVRLVAPTDMSVLLTGSSGTGKEYIARRIHKQSNRKNAPFVAIDCGAIPRELAASEFFGHVKGSFTGAIDHKTGAFEAAQGGTIFLDEIGNLTYEIQVQLLRALQEKKVKPIGSNREINTDIRFISATNENIRSAIDNGEFREDLYHRINEFTIRVPDLKERKEDILLFARHFLKTANRELNKNIAGFDAETTHLFQAYPWPGNLRQMKNAIRYATLLATGPSITLKELPEEMFPAHSSTAPHTGLRDELYERDMIQKALRESGNNKTVAARILGIDRKTLYNKLKHHGLDTGR
ncbi:MAG: sigma-54 dependent transcriptional regulator [Tannerellaceae bacterium]|jgi:two-component system response regulator HydG|nr:sigma-54 dependent transcriptional regulator [Tannerellaceae bacterium]